MDPGWDDLQSPSPTAQSSAFTQTSVFPTFATPFPTNPSQATATTQPIQRLGSSKIGPDVDINDLKRNWSNLPDTEKNEAMGKVLVSGRNARRNVSRVGKTFDPDLRLLKDFTYTFPIQHLLDVTALPTPITMVLEADARFAAYRLLRTISARQAMSNESLGLPIRDTPQDTLYSMQSFSSQVPMTKREYLLLEEDTLTNLYNEDWSAIRGGRDKYYAGLLKENKCLVVRDA